MFNVGQCMFSIPPCLAQVLKENHLAAERLLARETPVAAVLVLEPKSRD